MDPRVELLKAFYAGLPADRVKLETTRHGFAYLEELLAAGAELDYGELTLTGTLHKYKLSRVPAPQLDAFLQQHVAATCNVCRYFGPVENPLLSFNLDNNHRDHNTQVIPELRAAVDALRGILAGAGAEPLVLASGRGFHVWLRLAAPEDNRRLFAVMLGAAARVAARLVAEGLDRQRVKFNFYPDPRTENTVSLRLFGSVHAKNRVFSAVVAGDGSRLDEAASWAEFAAYGRGHTLSPAAFARLHAALVAPGAER